MLHSHLGICGDNRQHSTWKMRLEKLGNKTKLVYTLLIHCHKENDHNGLLHHYLPGFAIVICIR